MFCPNTGTKFHELYHLNHVIPRLASDMSEHFTKLSSYHNHNTRGSGGNFVVPSVSGVASTTFYYNAIKDWNELPSDIKTRSNFNNFKKSVKSYLRSQMQLTEDDFYLYYQILGYSD